MPGNHSKCKGLSLWPLVSPCDGAPERAWQAYLTGLSLAHIAALLAAEWADLTLSSDAASFTELPATPGPYRVEYYALLALN
jgi:hypothetical protein